ncbi:MAG: Xaa-Pro peptidase family protein [Pseudomonadota bacterium]
MSETSLVFEANEFRDRTRKLQDRMARHAIDALLLTSAADVFYATGFLTRFWESPARPWFIVVPSISDPIAIIPSIGEALMARSWLSDIRTWDAPNPPDDGLSLLADTLLELIPNRGKLAVPMGLETHLRMPLADYVALCNRLAPREIVDGTACIQRVREIKSEAEITKIRNICAIADRAFARVPEFAKRGHSLSDVFREFQIACLQEGADWVSYVAGAAGPEGYADVISPADDMPLKIGDILMLDTGAVRDGYYCDFDRNFSIGPASDTVTQTHRALWYATEDALSFLHPGLRACDVHQRLVEGIAKHGATAAPGRLGHGLGVTLTEWPSFTGLDQTTLQAGMVLTLEPAAFTTDGRLLVHEENVVLRDDGAELLTRRAPENMIEIEI